MAFEEFKEAECRFERVSEGFRCDSSLWVSIMLFLALPFLMYDYRTMMFYQFLCIRMLFKRRKGHNVRLNLHHHYYHYYFHPCLGVRCYPTSLQRPETSLSASKN